MAGAGDDPSVPRSGDGAPARVARWLASIPLTLAFGTVLATVFLVELWVFERFGFTAFTYLFVADAEPTPAWLLAPLAHTPFRPLHLVYNLALVVVFGGMVERRLPRGQYVAFLAVAGLASTAGQVATNAITGAGADSFGTLGASGIALAAAAYAVVTSVRRRRATGDWDGEETAVFVAAGAAAILVQVVTDFATPAAGVGRYGHLWGVLFGVGMALWGRGEGGE